MAGTSRCDARARNAGGTIAPLNAADGAARRPYHHANGMTHEI